MNIGLFGDSYCDIIYFDDLEYRAHPEKWGRQYKTWCGRLLDDYNAPILSSGLGGSSIYHSIDKWEKDKHKDDYDVVLWSLTWHNRLYTNEHFQPVFSARAERRPIPESDNPNISYHEINHGLDLYYKYFYQDNEKLFNFEQSVKWILERPLQYKNTKFIFLPCTEHARYIALKHFTNGVLVNFSFEVLSNLETGSIGPMPINCGRSGHMNDHNHEAFVTTIKETITNYGNIENQVIPLDFSNFDLVSIPNFNS